MKGKIKYPYELAKDEMDILLNIVTAEADISKEQILSKRGKRKISDVRSMICYLGMKRKIGSENIGRFLNGRHHTTVLFNAKAFAWHAKTEDHLKDLLLRVENGIE